ncbi:DUF2624 domain-containing protein [Bacillus luteolus]|uniref:DUF2624 domain-containing protein n=1 Tax=Litchfieldia luteola TaxID=682179 RepID=A0ABR9QHM9_9BACI|nr:DUF2624 domain-containing protein [Cytobacillus luteolus]MBE4907999.1 DUF2624 domain-containing protein [Cytobacillus luteolus]MBP1942782.1 hypothetical protein [Cytobacillus luteolus]
MSLFKNIINKKMNSITVDELLSYSQQYQVAINRNQAKEIVKLIRGKNINLFDDNERHRLLKQVARITSPEVARQLNTLFNQLL